jgi:hypothetical protein
MHRSSLSPFDGCAFRAMREGLNNAKSDTAAHHADQDFEAQDSFDENSADSFDENSAMRADCS